jgi:hypothetical protein
MPAGHALIGVDPGVTTGLAWGVFSPKLRDRTSLWKALSRGRQLGCEQIEEPYGVTSQIHVLIAEWMIQGFGSDQITIVIEDFQVRQNLAGGTGRDKLAPVYITGRIDEMLHIYQYTKMTSLVMSSVSKSLATDQRLKMWGESTSPPGKAGWVKGKRHTRDAWRLVAAGLNIIP